MGKFKELEIIRDEIYQAAADGEMDLTSFDLPEIEEMIDRQYLIRQEVNAFFTAKARCRSCGCPQDDGIAVDTCYECE